MIKLADHFQRDESARHSDWLRQQRWFIKAKNQNEQREKLEDKADVEFVAFASEAIAASQDQISEFQDRLDKYDAATVEAIMLNQQELDKVQQSLEAMLANAHTLEDGRRVFKTEDGTQVFDEFGAEMSEDEVAFESIAPDKPTWEEFQIEIELEQSLIVEQNQLLEFQNQLDDVREISSKDGTTVDELSELEADLEAAMPSSVSKILSPEKAENTVSTLDATTHTSPVTDMQSVQKATEHFAPTPM
ncbi:MAG: hypothetical protein AAGG02_18110 [Cyanobacteria bacterium P01_H01_bin.15]